MDHEKNIQNSSTFDIRTIANLIVKCDEVAIEVMRMKAVLEKQVRLFEIYRREKDGVIRQLDESSARIIFRILEFIDEIDNKQEYSEGFEKYTQVKLNDVLAREGIREFSVRENDLFDPGKHYIIQENSENRKFSNKILTSITKGYEKNGKILRRAGVTLKEEER